MDELARAAQGTYRPNVLRSPEMLRVDHGDAFRFGLWAGLGFCVAQFLFMCLVLAALRMLGWFPFSYPPTP